MKIKAEHYPYILLVTFIAFFILGVLLGFVPQH